MLTLHTALSAALRNGRRAVQNDREARNAFLDLLEDVEAQGRRNEYAFRVAGTLFRAEFVGPVRSAYRDGERIHARFGDEVHHLVGFGVGVVLGRYLVLDAGQHAEFAFHRYVELVGVFDHLAGERHVLVVGEVAAVDHHRREAHVDARFAEFEGVAVVEVQADGDVAAQLLGILYGSLGHVAQDGLVGVFACAARNLKDDGRCGFDASLYDGLHLFHVVEVEGRNGIFARHGLFEHLSGINQSQFLV